MVDVSSCQRGSVWRRWDPHIHAPGTALNDQFPAEDGWEKYLEKLEASSPTIEALGITDYYSTDCYRKVVAYKASGKLSNVQLIFPNVELRYGIGTDKGSPVNFHLLVSPDDRNHLERLDEFLTGLTFKAGGSNKTYRCTPDSIRSLGRDYSDSELDDRAAFSAGANQFKVEVDQFIEAWNDDSWIRANALIGLPGSNRDGAAGLQKDASLAALRQKIERIAHVIFASQPSQREFWSGQSDKISKEDFLKTYRHFKPCIHGCDAHDLSKVGEPNHKRYTWIKGDPTFESLRQACLEPLHRAIVATEAPTGALSSQTIESVRVENAEWFGDQVIPLNSGLVGVIGARGSGKTALADMVAGGAYALSQHVSEKSFVRRAGSLLGEAEPHLTWSDGSESSNRLDALDMEDFWDSPKVQYLSQQFVEQLCSSSGATQSLLKEIQRVIFLSHPPENRSDAENFEELLDLRAARGRQARRRQEEAIEQIGDQIGVLRDQDDALPADRARLKELTEQRGKDVADRAKLVPKSAEQHAKDFETVTAAAEKVRQAIELQDRRISELTLLQDHVKDYTERQAPNELATLRTEYPRTGLSEKEWQGFLLRYSGDVDATLASAIKGASERRNALKGPVQSTVDESQPPSEVSLLPADKPLADLPHSLLTAEASRLQRLIGVDAEKRKKHGQLSEKIRTKDTAIKGLGEKIKEAEGARGNIRVKTRERTIAYRGVFEGIVAEETALAELYDPLMNRLGTESGALGKLRFSIKRNVDTAAWAARGEALFDNRRGGFQGRGSLLKAATAELTPAWKSGDAEAVAEKMAAFREKHREDIVSSAKVDRKSDPVAWRQWAKDISAWLYDTEHIRLTYGIQYEGVELEALSPGTRGIVLLLLYLAIDTEDDRPLIIDQPEENLDPKSIFDELVELFRDAKLRRQIIVVTHNANLIVNTDAEQVIVAECGPLQSDQLPNITYTSGSLEDPHIRKSVCDILEGGEAAFQERAKRLRVKLAH